MDLQSIWAESSALKHIAAALVVTISQSIDDNDDSGRVGHVSREDVLLGTEEIARVLYGRIGAIETALENAQ